MSYLRRYYQVQWKRLQKQQKKLITCASLYYIANATLSLHRYLTMQPKIYQHFHQYFFPDRHISVRASP